jgi:tRNA(His) 5'-end guanylyltransferase
MRNGNEGNEDMIKNDSLGDRMKTYENVTRTHLTRRTPVIIRIDGKAFHTFTRGFFKPFDVVLVKSMQDTMKYLCENIEGCVLGYTQSDEITLVLCDYKKLTSQAWFNNNIQKMCSISASMATLEFNRKFTDNKDQWLMNTRNDMYINENTFDEEAFDKMVQDKNVYDNSESHGAMFDSRVFNIPKEEVNNCLIWRQQDATRNSIQSVAQANFSHKQLQNKNCSELQEMLLQEKGINWNDIPTHLKRGSCCIKEQYEIETEDGVALRSRWIIDEEIPIFSQDTSYVNSRIIFE